MAPESQPAHPRLIETLRPLVPGINFYRFCQLLEQMHPGRPPLGSTASPSDDPVRFRPHPGMGFPAGELKDIMAGDAGPRRPATVRTLFLGLYGVDSPLPAGFVDDVAQQREGHEAVESFLDIFNHRIATQYYRIWRKYSYPANFQPGGTDSTSQCLLGLIGLGIPGCSAHIATPVSRFLALLGAMRLPTRTAEGLVALVRFLAPGATAMVSAHDPVRIRLTQPARLARHSPLSLCRQHVLGNIVTEVNSQVHLRLSVCSAQEVREWLPGGQLLRDLLPLLRVYLGYRCTARLSLTIPTRLLPAPALGQRRVQLGRTGVLGLKPAGGQITMPMYVTVRLGGFDGLSRAMRPPEAEDVRYRY